MTRIRLTDAATLAQQSYKPHTIQSPRITDSLNTSDDVQAHLTETGVLLLPGSNSIHDYFHFNLRFFQVGPKRYRLATSSTERGASGTIWHQGFLIYSRKIFDWLGHRRPKLIIGHSLGAPATQVLSKTYNTPGIGFAAPRPRKGGGSVRHDDKCLSICRVDDTVCGLPPNFNHLGDARFFEPASDNWGLDHSMKNYRKILQAHNGPDQLPTLWP